MIKPEDLRLGDIVSTKIVDEVKLGVVSSIAMDTKGIFLLNIIDKQHHGYFVVDVEGVPLTLELLEKNGFKGEQHQKEGTSEWYDFYHYELGINIVYEVAENKFAAYLDRKKLREIQYAHELQHILWALGLYAELKV